MAASQQKLVKGYHLIKPDTTSANNAVSRSERIRIGLKLLYEFWGFCVNCPNSLTTPGAMLAATFPANFESGTSLISSGTDGETTVSQPGYFSSSSVEWSSSHVGKYLVIWKPGDDNPDDSIYKIIAIVSETTVLVDRYGGGGTTLYGNKPGFSDRKSIYFRVVEIDAIGDISGWSDGQGMVLTFSGSSDINPGQLNSQVRIFADSVSNYRFRLQISPSGSWSGSFSDGSSIIAPSNWSSTTGGNSLSTFYYLAGSRDHIIMYLSNEFETTSGGMHVEIPVRMHTASLDPNPIIFMTYGTENPSWICSSASAQADTFANCMFMVSHDGTTERYLPASRLPQSNLILATTVPTWHNSGIYVEGARMHMFDVNRTEQRVLSSDVIYYQENASRFSIGRVRMRKVRACHGNSPRGTRHGRNWIHMSNGVLVPWDNSVAPIGGIWRLV